MSKAGNEAVTHLVFSRGYLSEPEAYSLIERLFLLKANL